MAIGNAVERGFTVYVYDEKGHLIFTQPKGNSASDGLKGYTTSTVNIKRGFTVYTYDTKGRLIYTTPAR